MDTLEAIKSRRSASRRSVREFTGEEVSDEDLRRILDACRWAHSGLNNQPWTPEIHRKEVFEETA